VSWAISSSFCCISLSLSSATALAELDFALVKSQPAIIPAKNPMAI